MVMPPDSHVHTEWSWDTAVGDMEGSCERAVALGLPGIAFTEHFDHTVWWADLQGPYGSEYFTTFCDADGMVRPPPFDAAGYLAAVERCRERFPELRIFTGLEMGEPHRHVAAFGEVLATGRFDRVLGSSHVVTDGDRFAEPWGVFEHRDPAEVMREYLAGVADMVATSLPFSVVAHIDYPVRFWPGRFDPAEFEDEFRHALRETARSGRALEINTRLPLHATILGWWRDAGGDAVSFGSDAHLPDAVAHGFADAAAMAEAYGFRPGPHPADLWPRTLSTLVSGP
ncbi:PHP domain-containing protein [Actinoplanes sp. NPDC049596]|uniref:PHP domain-containing protein n=1 Tax=unclassified Actinoplanes TaxID=2626549 RepID=UPI00343BF997